MFLTRGIKVSFPRLIEMRTRSSKLHIYRQNIKTVKEDEQLGKRKMWLQHYRSVCHTYLWGQILRSSSVDFKTRSTEDCLLAGGGRGEGSSSRDQNLLRANPCRSSPPKFPNWKDGNSIIHDGGTKKEVMRDGKPEESKQVFLLWWSWEANTEPKWNAANKNTD